MAAIDTSFTTRLASDTLGAHHHDEPATNAEPTSATRQQRAEDYESQNPRRDGGRDKSGLAREITASCCLLTVLETLFGSILVLGTLYIFLGR